MADIQIRGAAGPIKSADGTAPLVRQGLEAEVVVADAIPRYSEATRRKRTYTAFTGLAGTTVVAANVSPVAAAAASILSLYNPPGSGVDAHIIKAWLEALSGTPGVGPWVYNTAFNQVVTATPNNGGVSGALPTPGYVGGATGQCKAFTQTALTGAGLQALARRTGAIWFGGAIAVTTPVLLYVDPVEGSIVVPPGGLLTIAAPLVGTTFVVGGGIEFQEHPAQT